MTAPPRLVVATTNPGKLAEIRDILGGVHVDLVPLSTFPDVAEPEERGTTFEENAREKALFYARVTGLPVVAEDSGLAIDALDGEPGVYSARYGGDRASTYPQKFALIQAKLKERGRLGSPARFVCALAVAEDEHVVFEARGTIEGRIAAEPAGVGGFGYDPIFFYPPLGRTLAELTADEKAAVSHRGKAFRALRDFLETRFTPV